MPVVRKFIRHCSPAVLQTYFSWANLKLVDIDWSQKQTTLFEKIVQQIDNFTDEEKARIRQDAERIVPMADALGQAALLSVVDYDKHFTAFSSPVARSLWVCRKSPLF